MDAEPLQKLICPACNARYEAGTFCSKDGTPLVPDQGQRAKNRVGNLIADRYKLVRLLGEGGMGQVYEGQHVNINKRFAIKMLRPEIVSNPEAVQRFRQEAWSASSIGHENIIEIDDFATLSDGTVYLAMEFLDGMPLAERLKNGPPLDLAQALDTFMQICRGLGAAHGKGIIHRDMKPENVFLGQRYGRMMVKILDFGIAKVSGADGTSHLTRTGQIFGTPHYMSPEQALGKSLDARSDIYSTGVMLYETFTGRIPFESESFMGILTKHIMTPPTPPTEIAPDVPPEIEAAILKAMAKDPADRFQDMPAFHDALWHASASLAPEIVASTPSQPMRAPSQPYSAASTPGTSSPALPVATPGQRTSASQAAAPGRVSRPMAPATAAAPAGPTSGAMDQTLPGSTPASLPAVTTPGATGRISKPPSGALATPTTDDLTPATKSRAPIFIVLALLVAAAGGGGAWYWQSLAATVTPKPQPPVAPTKPTPAPKAEAVLVESVPARAKIFVDGKEVGETPQPFVLQSGEKVNVTLRKDGYVEQSVELDPAKGKKVQVRLEKIVAPTAPPPETKPVAPVAETPKPDKHGKPDKHSKPGKLPPPPVVTQPTPTPTPPTQTQPTKPVTKPTKRDPYERLDEKKGSEILNPY